jgi:quercetin dioxygenase-like cupin family protein
MLLPRWRSSRTGGNLLEADAAVEPSGRGRRDPQRSWERRATRFQIRPREKVEAQGITQTIKLEEVVYGHLTELNGKFKLRATEVTFAPDAYLGAHHHVGPGIRCVLSTPH